jgi:feruloyl esterase
MKRSPVARCRALPAALLVAGLAWHPAMAQDCAALAGLALPETRIVSATLVPSGPFTTEELEPTFAPNIRARDLPAHCRVVGTIAPAIGFEVWLPVQGWNGRLQGIGNHRFGGAVPASDMAPELLRGYAVAGTDTGHAGEAPLPWMRNPQQVEDYGHRAVHEMTLRARAIIQTFYGRGPRYAYFNGCSTGGKQGLTQAQRYPGDYDGIVVGDPNNSQSGNRASYVWNAQMSFARPGGALGRPQLTLLHRGALAACDAQDGLADGVIGDPAACRFDPAVLACQPGQDPAACLTPPQVEASRALYAGPRNPRTGEVVYPGLAPGSELYWAPLSAGPRLFPTAELFYRHMVSDDPAWDFRGFDLDRDVPRSAAVAAIIDAVDPDLRAARDRGVRILHYHSWQSAVHAPGYSTGYYERVAAATQPGAPRAEALRRTGDFYRLFMGPGIASCGRGGDAPWQFDPIPVLEAWVERGETPERMIAIRPEGGAARPLCPYPMVARHDGTGDPNRAESFACAPP